MRRITSVLFLLIISACAGAAPLKQPAMTNELPCEPLGIMNLPTGECLGTAAARPAITGLGCVCGNPEYLAVQTDRGRTCVHLHSIFSLLEHIHEAIAELNIPEPKDLPSPLTLARPERRAAYDLLTQVRALDRNALELARLIRRDAPRDAIDRYVRYVQIGIAAIGKPTKETECASSPKPTSREAVLSMHRNF